MDRTGIAGDGIAIKPSERKHLPRGPILGRRGRLTVLFVIVGIAAVLAISYLPTDISNATPGRTGGNCGNCHPYRATSFLTVTFSPTITGGQYIPNTVYTITITLADTNGATGRNSFDLILSAGGGTLSTTDPNAEINSATEATALVYTVASWTVEWTAPASGAVTINTWAVLSGTATGSSAPYDRITTSLGASAIPEFPVLIIPIFAAGAAVVLGVRASRKRGS